MATIERKKWKRRSRENSMYGNAGSKYPFPISRSKLELCHSCRRCFWLDRVKGIGRPGIPGFLLYPTIVVEIILPLFVIIGYQARVSAGLLAIFCIATAFLFHYDFVDQMQTIAFLKNLGLAGGFLFIVANGTRDWSVDREKKYVRL